jgi:hypothetical protein
MLRPFILDQRDTTCSGLPRPPGPAAGPVCVTPTKTAMIRPLQEFQRSVVNLFAYELDEIVVAPRSQLAGTRAKQLKRENQREACMTNNVIRIALITAVVAASALPGTASASCSGNTCSFGTMGKVTYLPAKQSTVAPLLTKMDTSYSSAESSYSQAIDLFKELKSLTSKFGTKEQIAAEALARRAKSESLKSTANNSAGFGAQLQLVQGSIEKARKTLVNARTSLQLAQRELQNVQDANRVSQLKAAAEKAQNLDIFGVAFSAADELKNTGELSATTVFDAATKLVGAFRSANLKAQAEELEAAVSKSSEAVGKEKIVLAASQLKEAQTDLEALVSNLGSAKTAYENGVKIRNADYNKGDAPKYGRLEDITKAEQAAGRLVNLLKQAYADAYTVQQTVDKLERTSDWLAPPQSESTQTLQKLKTRADFIFKDCVNQRPIIESVQKLIQEAYAAANASLNSPL